MKIILSILLVLSLLVVSGCAGTVQDEAAEEMLADNEEIIEEITAQLPDSVDQEPIEDQLIYEDENITMKVEDGVYVTEVDSVVDFESAPFSEWCIPGEIYDFSSEDQEIKSTIIGVTTYDNTPVCEAHHTMTQEYVGEIETVYYISEESNQIWVLSTMMGQTTESYVDMR